MGAKRTEPAGLSHAREVIENLDADLRWTLRSVEVLTRHGQLEEARELLDVQRSEMDEAVRLLAHDVAATRGRRLSVATRSLAVAAAAAVVVLSVGVAVMRSSGVTAPRHDAIAPTAQVHTDTAAPAPRSVAPAPARASAARVSTTTPTRGHVGRTDPPIVNSRFESAVRADGPAVSPSVSVSPSPLGTPLPDYLRKIN